MANNAKNTEITRKKHHSVDNRKVNDKNEKQTQTNTTKKLNTPKTPKTANNSKKANNSKNTEIIDIQ